MGRKGLKILEDLIIPSLTHGSFGHRLHWEDERERILNIFWRNKNNCNWMPADHEIFKKWDELKGRKTSGTDYYTASKGRFRSALKKISTVIELKSTKEGYKQFQIVLDQKKKKKKKDDQVVGDENPSSSELSSLYGDSPREFTNDLLVNITTQENENCNDIGNLDDSDWEMPLTPPLTVNWNKLFNAESKQESNGVMEEHSVLAIDRDPELDYSDEPAIDLDQKKKSKDDQVVNDKNPSSPESSSFYSDSPRECTNDLCINIIAQKNENRNDIGNLDNFALEMPLSVDWNELLNAVLEQESKSGAMEEHSVPTIDLNLELKNYLNEPPTDLEFF